MIIVPIELKPYFSLSNFKDYPLIEIPQSFYDQRGSILNLGDGQIGDVSFITSNEGAVRANHVHHNDWHLCYLITGHIQYSWKETLSAGKVNQVEVEPGEMIYTPPGVPHKMYFPDFSQFITISKLSRLTDSYEQDTSRFTGLNFES